MLTGALRIRICLFIKTNIVGTQRLLEAVRSHCVKKYVQISTDEVYGSAGSSGCFKEDSLLQPSSPYSTSEVSANLLALSNAGTYGMNVMITQCSNNYGPCQFPRDASGLLCAFFTHLRTCVPFKLNFPRFSAGQSCKNQGIADLVNGATSPT
jgi:dTDP-D-glucose 4,6-dehydratase